MRKGIALACAAGIFITNGAGAATWYVAPGGNNGAGTNWVTAKQTIQAAIDLAVSNDTVLVSNGVYATGGRVVFGVMTNRVAITNAITVRSVNGPDMTVIRGSGPPAPNAVRCVYVGTNAVLSGFTLTNGATRTSGDVTHEQYGGGAWCEGSGSLTNCTLTGNAAFLLGGGAAYGTLNNCVLIGNIASAGGGSYASTVSHSALTGNTATNSGGGSCYGILNNCVLKGNSAMERGGGSYYSVLNNCTLTGNSAQRGGGSDGGTQYNCIVYYNISPTAPNYWESTLRYSCTTPMPAGADNITNEPALASASHLAAGSPCIGAGDAAYATGTDIDGDSWRNPPSMGCDEWVAGSITGALNTSAWAAYTNVTTGFSVAFRADISGRTTASAWQWGDGGITSNQPYATHAFSSSGVYTVVLRAYNESYPLGVAATVTVQVATQMIHHVRISNAGAASPFTTWATAATNIQTALDAVSQAGALVLVSNGVYSSGGRVVYGAMTNRVAITNAITLRSVNGPAVTTIAGRSDPISTNGNAGVRCVYAGANSMLSGFTLTGGHTRTNGHWAAEQYGGGVWCDPSVVVSNCVISSNSALYGGGGAYQGTLINCTITNNSTGGWGGGADSAALSNCVLVGNTASGGGGANMCSLRNCTLARNSALFAGGGGAANSSLSVCSLSNNTAGQDGGGAAMATLIDCAIVGNVALNGGGAAGGCILTNCTLIGNLAGNCGGGSAYGCVSYNCVYSGNTATNNGGGSYWDTLYNCALSSNSAFTGGGSANGMLFHCTLLGNSAQFGGGSYNDTLNNCIVYFNSASLGANWQACTSIQFSCTTPLPDSGTGNFTNAPGLAGIYNPHLTLRSPCIDAAATQYVFTATDLDGNPRTNGPAVDVGAIEFTPESYTGTLTAAIGVVPSPNAVVGFPLVFVAALGGRPHNFTWSFGDGLSATNITMMAHAFAETGTYQVVLRATNLNAYVAATASVQVVPLAAATRYVRTNGSDSAAGTAWTNAKQTIRGAITNIPAAGGLVLVSNGVYSAGGTFWRGLSNQVVLINGVTVQSANGPATTAIRGAANPSTAGNGSNAVRCAYVSDGCVLSGFTLTNGFTSAKHDSTGCGGGVFCETAGAIITNCLIVSNSAYRYGGGAWGGTLNNCTLSRNAASLGGGGSAYATLKLCSLSGNSAVSYGGGGYASTLDHCTMESNRASHSGGGSYACVLNDCSISNNSATFYGGGSFQDSMSRCTLRGNTAVAGGGAYSGVLSNCTVTGNSAGSGGGSVLGTLVDCTLNGNVSSQNGGGSYQDTLIGCALTGNYATNFGGGAYQGTLYNCRLSGNTAKVDGGGSYGSTQNNCIITGNAATNDGGGAHQGFLVNCLLAGNTAKRYGGGANGSTLVNCTLSSNTAFQGGGSYEGRLCNCIVYFNSASSYSNYILLTSVMTNCCTTPNPGGVGNITNDPLFVSTGVSNFHLLATSPCIDKGSNNFARGETDLDGNPRIVNGTVDMGAFEYRGAGSPNLVWYVAPSGSDTAPGTNWATAKRTIHGAIDRTLDGDTVLVSNGIYATGGRTVGGWSITNRVAITNAITVRSENGPGVTTIRGAWDPVTTNGDAAVRCVYVGANAALSGFTLTGGATRASGFDYYEQSGGGAWCEVDAQVSNCVITGNTASNYGGGALQGILNNCTLKGNSAGGFGGGAALGTLIHCAIFDNASHDYGGGVDEAFLIDCVLSNNRAAHFGGGSSGSRLLRCTVSGNSAGYGGGSYNDRMDRCILAGNSTPNYGGGACDSRLTNCMLSGNSAVLFGGGAFQGLLWNCTVVGNSASNLAGGGGLYVSEAYNCIVYFNVAPASSNCVGPVNYSCTTPDPGGTGNITNEPQFVDTAAGNFHVKATSPCIDAGNNAYATSSMTDLDGNLRIGHGTVDMGAYEFQPYWWWASAITNGLTNLIDCATGDGYPNLLKFATGSSATQSDALARMDCTRSNGQFALRFNRNTNAFDITLLVEGSFAATNDAVWTPIATNAGGSWGGATNVSESGASTPAVVTVQDTAPPSANRFLRLRVARP